MKFKYRGRSYEYKPSEIEMEPGPVVGKYRGQQWQLHYPRHMNVPQPAMALKYRGIAYRTTETGGIETPRPKTVDGTPVQIPTKVPTHKALEAELTKTHRAYLVKRLAHRLEVARANGDEQLVRLLEWEQQQMA